MWAFESSHLDIDEKFKVVVVHSLTSRNVLFPSVQHVITYMWEELPYLHVPAMQLYWNLR